MVWRRKDNLKKIVIEIEAENPRGIEVYLREVLSTMAKNNFFSIKRFNIEVVDR